MRNHTYPAWALQIYPAAYPTDIPFSDPKFWYYATWQDEPADPDAPVRFTEDGYRFSWEFDGEALPPTSRNPTSLTIKLSCATAADLPAGIAEGFIIRTTLIRPHGVPAKTGPPGGFLTVTPPEWTYIVQNNFRVRNVTSVWNRTIRRMIYTIECVDLSVDLGTPVDLDRDWDTEIYDYYADQLEAGETVCQSACRSFIAGRSTIRFAERWHPEKVGQLALTNLQIRREEVMSVADITSACCSPEFAEDGSKYILYTSGSVEQLPFDPYHDVTEDNPDGVGPNPVWVRSSSIAPRPPTYAGCAFLAEWSPSAEITNPPYELALDGSGHVIAVLDPTADVDPIALPASLIEISPEWRRDPSRAINQVIWSGWNSTSDKATATTIENQDAQNRSGIIARSIDSFALLSGPAAPTPTVPSTVVLAYIEDKRVDESSYLAYSSKHSSEIATWWTGNDEGGNPQLFAINDDSDTVGIINFTGVATPVDPEALCIYKDYMYLADIGDNAGPGDTANRPAGNIRIYRFTEPGELGTNSRTPVVFQVSYGALGSINAESYLMKQIDEQFIITKEATHSRLLRHTGHLTTSGFNTFSLVNSSLPPFVSDACFSVDGTLAFLKVKDDNNIHVWSTAGSWSALGTFAGPSLVQGESITANPLGDRLYVSSEVVDPANPSPIYRVGIPAIYQPAAPAYYGTRLTQNAHNHFLKDLYISLSDDGSPWAPDEMTVVTNLMTDEQLNVYTGRFNPVEQQQQTFVIYDIEPEANPASGPIWATLIGAEISIQRLSGEGRLVIVPVLKPYRAPGVTSPNSVTWDDFSVSPYSTKTFDDLDPSLTADLLALTHA